MADFDDPYVVVQMKENHQSKMWEPIGVYGPFEGTVDAVAFGNTLPSDSEWDFYRLEKP